MIKVISISDNHLGLKTDGIDRTPEIIKVFRQAVKHAAKLKKQGHEVYLIFGGDIFNDNNPSESLIALFIGSVLNPIRKFGIKCYIIPGNHDSLYDPENLSCLSFIKEIEVGYPTISLQEHISHVHIKDTDLGPLYFTFLPHVTKASVVKYGDLFEFGETYSGTQDFIEKVSRGIKENQGRGSQNYVFSHLNVRGAHPGSEENLLKKSEVYLPSAFTEKEVGYELPDIIQYHIHSHDIINNIYIVGSPIFCTFGESDKQKCFLELTIPETFDEKKEFKRIPTISTKFVQYEMDASSWDSVTKELIVNDSFLNSFMTENNVDKNTIFKLDITVNPKGCTADWQEVAKELKQKFGCHVKPIDPRYTKLKMIRSKEQRIDLSPTEATKVFLRTHKPKRTKEKWKLAQTYLR